MYSVQMVPREGVEPSSLSGRDFKSRAYTNSATAASFIQNTPLYQDVIIIEATGGIEPPYIPFAEECLTTWLRGPKLFSK